MKETTNSWCATVTRHPKLHVIPDFSVGSFAFFSSETIFGPASFAFQFVDHLHPIFFRSCFKEMHTENLTPRKYTIEN